MRKRTKAQRQASRRNGALSRGPITAEGKAIVAHNAISHGLTAKVNLLTTEERPAFNALLQSFLATFAPQSDPEFCCVEEMATAKWKMRRAWAMETARLDLQMDRDTAALNAQIASPDHATRTSLAWIAARPDLEPFHRYASQLLRDHDRAYRHLQQLRNERAETADNPGQNHDLAEIQNKPEEPHVDRQ
jgi:hypothetical protein